MRVTKVSIKNILGIEALEFSPGNFTVVSGANGSGKSSTLEAIRAALKGGSDATLLRQGAERGEVVLVLDDGTSIRRRVTPKGGDTEVSRGDAVLKKPATVIAGMADLLSVNPVEFLRAPDKDRVRVLLETMPIDVDYERVADIAGLSTDGRPTETGLDLIESARRRVYDSRTGINRALKDKGATIRQLQEALPPEAPVAPSTADLQVRAAHHRATYDAELARITTKTDSLCNTHAEEIARLEAEIGQHRAAIDSVRSRAETARAKAESSYREAMIPVNIAIDNADAARAALTRYATTRETIDTLLQDLDALTAESAACEKALEALAAYRASLIDALPIPGLEVRDGALYRNGIAFDRLNTAQQVAIAVEIAKMRAGPLGLVCVDGLELLDAAAFDAFKDMAAESGLQLFVSRVSDGALSVETE